MRGPRLPVLRSMTLTVTERCNLRCAYCYVPVARGRTMSEGVADAAVELLARHAAPEGTVTLSFFGGEPFLATTLLRRAAERARSVARDGRRLRLTTTTNGLLLDDGALDFCHESGMELAVSVDGDASSTDRPYANGRGSTSDVLANLPAILSLEPGAKLIARMTVTPDNVGELARRVQALARLGFRRIFFLPAYEMDWTDDAVRAFGREHRRIGAWIAAAKRSGAFVPELPTWRGIEARLARGRAKGACGAGVSQVAVATDGRLLACYRLLSEPDADRHVLGDVVNGFTNDEALRHFASLDPADVQPEDGDCASCSARDGCTHSCPALGIAMRGDARAVPRSVCELTRAAVEAVRESMRGSRCRSGARTAWTFAAVAAVSGAALACGGSVDGGGGLCPALTDAGADARDAATDAEDAPSFAYDSGGGLCPVQVDAQVDAGDAGGGGGGICLPPPGVCN
ncbi:MAG TPA: radical SAM protein [Polyangiaceae bacterium]